MALQTDEKRILKFLILKKVPKEKRAKVLIYFYFDRCGF
jgi:hypothetical protein